MTAVVYTSICGGYDTLRPHIDHPDITEWICYTDNPDLSCDGWRTVYKLSAPDVHPRMVAKRYKCYPPVEYDQSIWIDGCQEIIDPEFITATLELLESDDMVMWSHPDRTSIIAEAMASESMAKYHGLPVMRQAQHYCWSWGWPDDELWASTVIGRNHRPNVLALGADWFGECEYWTYQDQISLPPLVRRNGVSVAPLPYTLWRNPWFRRHHHASDA
jgi:hypothetical protein